MSSPIPREADVVVALGLNLPPRSWRWRRLVSALGDLPGSRLVAVAGPVSSSAVGAGVSGRFLNGVAHLRTCRPPRALLADMKRLERRLGRRADGGNRPADIDILLWRDAAGRWRHLRMPGLRVPHPRMLERPFVLGPLRTLPFDGDWPAPVQAAIRLHN